MLECDICGKEVDFGGTKCENCGAEVCDQCLVDLESEGKIFGKKRWKCSSCGKHKLAH